MTEGQYAAEWQEYRSRARHFWAIALTFVPMIAWLSSVLERRFVAGVAVLVPTIIWGAALNRAESRKSLWPCPRCAQPFFRDGIRRNPFTDRCLHCTLPKWAGESASVSS